jgi:hypothetical protein
MATKHHKVYVCDRCGHEQPDNGIFRHAAGYVSFGPVNGAASDHIGIGQSALKQHADICDTCRVALLKWWRSPHTGV